jgi:TetR/AcrR family transcriptional repressor of nem operon
LIILASGPGARVFTKKEITRNIDALKLNNTKLNKAEQTRAFIIRKTSFLIGRYGINSTPISKILSATGLTKGAIYGNFEDKDEIFAESFKYLSGSLSRELDKAVSKGRNAWEKLFNLLDAYDLNSTLEFGCPIISFGLGGEPSRPEIQLLVKMAILQSQNRISVIVSEGILNGEIADNLDPDSFGIKVFAMIEGAILCSHIAESDAQIITVIQEVKKEFIAYLL